MRCEGQIERLEGIRQLLRPRNRWKYNNKMNIKNSVLEFMFG
jgi:hypothetical protein